MFYWISVFFCVLLSLSLSLSLTHSSLFLYQCPLSSPPPRSIFLFLILWFLVGSSRFIIASSLLFPFCTYLSILRPFYLFLPLLPLPFSAALSLEEGWGGRIGARSLLVHHSWTTVPTRADLRLESRDLSRSGNPRLFFFFFFQVDFFSRDFKAGERDRPIRRYAFRAFRVHLKLRSSESRSRGADEIKYSLSPENLRRTAIRLARMRRPSVISHSNSNL